MKITVSIPDSMWDEALKSSTVGASPSAVVQEALRRTTRSEAGRRRPNLDAETEMLFNQTRDRIREDADRIFERGYTSGVRLAARVRDWNQLKWLLDSGITTAFRAEGDHMNKARVAGGGEHFDTLLRGTLFTLDDRDGVRHSEEDDDFLNRLIVIDSNNNVIGTVDLHPLLLAGAERALRDVFDAAAPDTPHTPEAKAKS